eukprot:977221_1
MAQNVPPNSNSNQDMQQQQQQYPPNVPVSPFQYHPPVAYPSGAYPHPYHNPVAYPYAPAYKRRQVDPNHNPTGADVRYINLPHDPNTDSLSNKYIQLLEENVENQKKIRFMERELMEMKAMQSVSAYAKKGSKDEVDLDLSDDFVLADLGPKDRQAYRRIYGRIRHNYSIKSLNGYDISEYIDLTSGFLTHDKIQRRFKLFGLIKLMNCREINGVPAVNLTGKLLRNGLRTNVVTLGHWAAHSIIGNKTVCDHIVKVDVWTKIFGGPYVDFRVGELTDVMKQSLQAKYFQWPHWFVYDPNFEIPDLDAYADEVVDGCGSKEEMDADADEKEKGDKK